MFVHIIFNQNKLSLFHLQSKIFEKTGYFDLSFEWLIMVAMVTHVPFHVRSHNLFGMHILTSNCIDLKHE
jgi:hypothetical protein